MISAGTGLDLRHVQGPSFTPTSFPWGSREESRWLDDPLIDTDTGTEVQERGNRETVVTQQIVWKARNCVFFPEHTGNHGLIAWQCRYKDQ